MISHYFLGTIVDAKEGGDINMRHLYEQHQLQLKLLDSSEVGGHKPSLQCL